MCFVPLSLILSVEFYGAIKYFLVWLCSSFGSCRSNDNAYDSALGRSLQWRHMSFMVTQITHNWTVCSTICRDSVATKNCKGYSLVPLTKGQYCGKRFYDVMTSRCERNWRSIRHFEVTLLMVCIRDFYPGTLSLDQVTTIHSQIGHIRVRRS